MNPRSHHTRKGHDVVFELHLGRQLSYSSNSCGVASTLGDQEEVAKPIAQRCDKCRRALVPVGGAVQVVHRHSTLDRERKRRVQRQTFLAADDPDGLIPEVVAGGGDGADVV